MRSAKIMVCGNPTIDELVTNDGVSLSPGGSAIFASCASAYLGSRVRILGNVGADYSPAILRRLNVLGLNTSFLKRTDGPSTRFRITRFNGSRRLELLQAGDSVGVPSNVSKFGAIHLGPVFNEISATAIESLRKKCDLLSADLQGFIRKSSKSGLIRTGSKNLSPLLAVCDIVQASFEEARSQTHLRNPKNILNELLKLNVKYAILTMGNWGSWLGSRDGEPTFVPAYSDRSVTDPTGAGDIFAGSWITTYLMTKDPLWASAVGAGFASLASRRTGLSKFHLSRHELFRRAGWIYNQTKCDSNRNFASASDQYDLAKTTSLELAAPQ